MSLVRNGIFGQDSVSSTMMLLLQNLISYQDIQIKIGSNILIPVVVIICVSIINML